MKHITVKLDLWDYKQVDATCKLVAEKLGLEYGELENDLLNLSHELEIYRNEQDKQPKRQDTTKRLDQHIIAECLTFLKTKDLLGNINKMIEQGGITGEETNRLLLFVIASSYKMNDTLHALIQGSSGSGKTRLLKIISELMPEEDVKRYTRVTDNSLYNQDEYFFVNKLVCFEDLDGLKEDAQLAVRELQSNEILVTSTSIKDANGSIRGGERVVRGPIASLSCTTKGEIYEDNISRCFLIAVDESMEQTKRIIHYQNQVSAGAVNLKSQEQAKVFLQNCVRLLRPKEVINPYANKIHLPEDAHKIRRLNELYQSFVKQITLIHQYQRKEDTRGRLISEKEDLQLALDILFESILLKVDELDGSLRQFYEKLKVYADKKGRNEEFTRFEVRETQDRPNRRTKVLLKGKTIYTHIKTLEKFYLFAYKYAHISSNPFTSLVLKYPALEKPTRTILSNQEVSLLYTCAENQQERAILSLAYGCGLRAKEIEYLNSSDILFRERLLVVQQGKGYKRRVVPLSRAVLQDLENYYREERPSLLIRKSEQAFLLNTRGNRLRAWTLNKRLKQIIERVGRQSLHVKTISLHNLRHSIASHLLEQGLSVEQVRVFLGHTYLETTQIYTQVNTQQLQQSVSP